MRKFAAASVLFLGISAGNALLAEPCNGEAKGNPHCVQMTEPSALPECIITVGSILLLVAWRTRHARV